MGFFKKLYDIVADVVEESRKSMEKRYQKIQFYKEKYKDYDDERLKEEYKRSSDEKKIALTALLKERGYFNE